MNNLQCSIALNISQRVRLPAMSAWLPKKHCHSSILVNSVLVAVGGCTLAVGSLYPSAAMAGAGLPRAAVLLKHIVPSYLLEMRQNLSESFVFSRVEGV